MVYSTEVPSDVALLPLADAELAKGSVDELAPLRDFRVRILPVLGPLPAIFGLHIATYVLCELAGRTLERPLPVRHRKKLYERMWKDLLHRESRIARKQIKFRLFFPVSTIHRELTAFVFEQLAPFDNGGHRAAVRRLCPWPFDRPAPVGVRETCACAVGSLRTAYS